VPIPYNEYYTPEGAAYLQIYPLKYESVDFNMTRPALKNQDNVRPITSVIPLDPPFELDPPEGTNMLETSGINSSNTGMVVNNVVSKTIFDDRYFDRKIKIPFSDRGNNLGGLTDCSLFYNTNTQEHMVCHGYTITNRNNNRRFNSPKEIYARKTSHLFDILSLPFALPAFVPTRTKTFYVNNKNGNFQFNVHETYVDSEHLALQHFVANLELDLYLCPVSQITRQFAEYPYLCGFIDMSDNVCTEIIRKNDDFKTLINRVIQTL